MNPEEGIKAGGELEDVYEKQLSTSGLSGMEKRRLRCYPFALYNFLRRGNGEGGAELFLELSVEEQFNVLPGKV